MSATAENLRHAAGSAADLARHVWGALTEKQRAEMCWQYDEGIRMRLRTGSTDTAQRELTDAALLSSNGGPCFWGRFVFVVGQNGGDV